MEKAEEKALKLIKQLGAAIVEKRALELELDRLSNLVDFGSAEFDNDGFRILTPKEIKLDEEHYQSFLNILKIEAEISVLSLELIGADSSEEQKRLKGLEKKMKTEFTSQNKLSYVFEFNKEGVEIIEDGLFRIHLFYDDIINNKQSYEWLNFPEDIIKYLEKICQLKTFL